MKESVAKLKRHTVTASVNEFGRKQRTNICKTLCEKRATIGVLFVFVTSNLPDNHLRALAATWRQLNYLLKFVFLFWLNGKNTFILTREMKKVKTKIAKNKVWQQMFYIIWMRLKRLFQINSHLATFIVCITTERFQVK